jgi:hypothetical protein
MMSHPDPLFDPDNSYKDDDMAYNYDDHDDFYQECEDYNDYYIEENNADEDEDVDSFDDSMDGDHESGLASCGWGTDEDYGYYGDDREDFHADDAIGYVDYNEDGPYDD